MFAITGEKCLTFATTDICMQNYLTLREIFFTVLEKVFKVLYNGIVFAVFFPPLTTIYTYIWRSNKLIKLITEKIRIKVLIYNFKL